MNADWAKGRNERTGLDGIFPRSYVTIVEDKQTHSASPRPTTSNYGNLPLDISQSGGSSGAPAGKESKFNQNGKKFGKKLGNASQSPKYHTRATRAFGIANIFQRFLAPGLLSVRILSMGYFEIGDLVISEKLNRLIPIIGLCRFITKSNLYNVQQTLAIASCFSTKLINGKENSSCDRLILFDCYH